MTRYSKATTALAALIENDFLAPGAGRLDIKVDDIVVAMYKRGMATTLTEAMGLAAKSLRTVWRYLWSERDWHGVPVTSYFFDTFVNDDRALGDDQTTEFEIKKCVAGLGRAQRFVGFHYFVGDDDYLFLWYTVHHKKAGQGKDMAVLERVIDVAESQQLSGEKLRWIANTSKQDSRIIGGQIKQIEKLAAGAKVED